MPDAAPNLFERLALDRAAERRDDAAWLQQAWRTGRLIQVDFEGRAPLRDEALGIRDALEFATDLPEEACFLGVTADARAWFALAPGQVFEDTEATIGLREAAARLSAFESGLFAYAKALLLWHSRARFCGACGAPTRVGRGGHMRRCSAPACTLEHYPRTDCAVIVLVTDGRRGLLGRGANWPERRYSTLAGFVEPGESLEDALRREVFEESGVRVGPCTYDSAQPWPFPASLMIGFHAEAIDPTIRLGEELADARWWDPEEVLQAVHNQQLLIPPPIALSFRLIDRWLVDQLGEPAVRAVLPPRRLG